MRGARPFGFPSHLRLRLRRGLRGGLTRGKRAAIDARSLVLRYAPAVCRASRTHRPIRSSLEARQLVVERAPLRLQRAERVAGGLRLSRQGFFALRFGAHQDGPAARVSQSAQTFLRDLNVIGESFDGARDRRDFLALLPFAFAFFLDLA